MTQLHVTLSCVTQLHVTQIHVALLHVTQLRVTGLHDCSFLCRLINKPGYNLCASVLYIELHHTCILISNTGYYSMRK